MKQTDLARHGLTLIGTGAQADVYLRGGRVIKLYRSADKAGEAHYELEQMRRARALVASAPQVYGLVEIDGLPGVEMEYLSGETLGGKILTDREHADRYLEASVDLQLAFHALHASEFPPLKERLRDRIGGARQLTKRQRDALLTRLRDLQDGDALCHGDFHLLNLIDTEHGLRVIDWIDATRGPALADAGRTFLLYALVIQEISGEYLDCYVEKSGCSKQAILDWLPVLAGARLREGNSPEDERTLIKIVDELY